MNRRIRTALAAAIALSLLFLLPLGGIVLAGRSVATFLEFPPVTQYVAHAGFSWAVFTGFAIFTLALVLPFVLHRGRSREPKPSSRVGAYRFPWWGWLGLGLGLAAWILAWTRFTWFSTLQPFTFSPLWFAYILAINALAFRRTGRCLMTSRPLYFALLFPTSAIFWWYFEYLNRFVQNWYYVSANEFSPLQYFIFATLPFSTVLPAVLSTREWLGGFPGLVRGLDSFHRWDVGRKTAGFVLLIACIGLAGIGSWPDYLFPLLWLAPLFVMLSIQVLSGERTILSSLVRGDWRNITLFALAALMCGFFWEMWNFYSQAKWIYAVPWVNRFHLFEMPLVGYTGYLPFGLECAVVGDWLDKLIYPPGPEATSPSHEN